MFRMVPTAASPDQTKWEEKGQGTLSIMQGQSGKTRMIMKTEPRAGRPQPSETLLNQHVMPRANLVQAQSEDGSSSRAFTFESEDYATSALREGAVAVGGGGRGSSAAAPAPCAIRSRALSHAHPAPPPPPPSTDHVEKGVWALRFKTDEFATAFAAQYRAAQDSNAAFFDRDASGGAGAAHAAAAVVPVAAAAVAAAPAQ